MKIHISSKLKMNIGLDYLKTHINNTGEDNEFIICAKNKE